MPDILFDTTRLNVFYVQRQKNKTKQKHTKHLFVIIIIYFSQIMAKNRFILKKEKKCKHFFNKNVL